MLLQFLNCAVADFSYFHSFEQNAIGNVQHKC